MPKTRHARMLASIGTLPPDFPVSDYVGAVLGRLVRDGRRYSPQDAWRIAQRLADKYSGNPARTMTVVARYCDLRNGLPNELFISNRFMPAPVPKPMTTFHIYKAGELYGSVEAHDQGEAEKLMREKYGRSQLLVLVADKAGARAMNAARKESERLAEVSRARLGRPKAETTREAISIKVEPHVLDYFRSSGPGWQSRIHAVLAEYVTKAERRERRGTKSGPSSRSFPSRQQIDETPEGDTLPE